MGVAAGEVRASLIPCFSEPGFLSGTDRAGHLLSGGRLVAAGGSLLGWDGDPDSRGAVGEETCQCVHMRTEHAHARPRFSKLRVETRSSVWTLWEEQGWGLGALILAVVVASSPLLPWPLSSPVLQARCSLCPAPGLGPCHPPAATLPCRLQVVLRGLSSGLGASGPGPFSSLP